MIPKEVSEDSNPKKYDENIGLYLVLDQELYIEDRAEEDFFQGLGAFFQFSWAPDNRNEVTRYTGGGLTYTGPFSGRDNDVMGLGFARAVFSSNLPDSTHETSIELFYKYWITRWMFLQPDVQYIINPNGLLDDALAIGIRAEIAF